MCAICSAYVGAVRPARKNTREELVSRQQTSGDFDMMPLSASRLATLDDCQGDSMVFSFTPDLTV